jgi:hypothetical protein
MTAGGAFAVPPPSRHGGGRLPRFRRLGCRRSQQIIVFGFHDELLLRAADAVICQAAPIEFAAPSRHSLRSIRRNARVVSQDRDVVLEVFCERIRSESLQLVNTLVSILFASGFQHVSRRHDDASVWQSQQNARSAFYAQRCSLKLNQRWMSRLLVRHG